MRGDRVAAALTAERLRELLDYDPATGIFTWRVWRGGRAHAGAVAGSIDVVDGYRRMRVDGANYLAQRLAWLYMTGEWPAVEIDHRDCERDNNRFLNLREATRSQNQKNSRIQSNNTSGFKGARFKKDRGRWVAEIRHAGRAHHLGYFTSAEEAHAAYCAAAAENDPEFARFG